VDLHNASDHEITINDYLKSNPIEHPGKILVRRVLDSFEIEGPNGKHKCILYQPLGMRFTEYLILFPQKTFPKDLAHRSVQLLLIALGNLPLMADVSKCWPIPCDLGEARVGTQKFRGDIMPEIYRAPEVILDMEWDSKVDIWAMGIMLSTNQVCE